MSTIALPPRRVRNTLFFLGATTLASAAFASLGAQTPQRDDAFVRGVDSIFAPFTAHGSPGCIVGVDRPDKEFFAKGYGLANLEYNIPLTANSISESGSVAKQFTAAALVLLQADGKLSLDDDVKKYISELPDFGARITIRNLLTHTSGLRDQWALLGLMGRGPGQQVHTQSTILDLVAHQRDLNFAPGSSYLYSNTGYVLAATIVSRVSGMPFAQFTVERLFKPLGMTNTQWRDDYRRVVPDRATAYSREKEEWMQDMPFTMVHGNGGLLTTAADLQKWNRALTDGLLGRPELTRVMETPPRLTNGHTITYALGLVVAPWTSSVREVSHSGATAGYRTFLARYPEAKVSISVFCNVGNANPIALGRRVIDLVIPRPASSAALVARTDQAVRTRLAGTYRDPRSDEWTTIYSAGDYLRSSGLISDTLRQGTNGSFTVSPGVQLTFDHAGQNAQHLTILTPDSISHPLERVSLPARASIKEREYAGTYHSPELNYDIVVRMVGERLMMRTAPNDESALVPFYADGFKIGESGYTIRFVRNSSGKVSGFRAFVGRALNVRFDRVTGR